MQDNLYRFLSSLLFTLLFTPLLYGTPAAQSAIFYKEGVELFKQGELDSAENKFMESLKLSPYASLAYYGLGRIYLAKEGNIDEAITCLRKSVQLDSGLAKGFFYLGLAELMGEKYVEALHSFKNAYDLDKGLVESLYNIAVIYEHLGKSYNAFVYYRKYVDEIEND
ncbi:MAG TPA: tetratricopeptide repeat protein [Spirochaetota bacterium]|nr:tetratricopeptide repeat protein [Spirochaetota bacterium]HPF06424.1 tetratricopeptide repeat protein [Spirochaetota bacterium]HRX47096.1 tetratricopeptide repeat protein [Spirochaetota bacterium]